MPRSTGPEIGRRALLLGAAGDAIAVGPARAAALVRIGYQKCNTLNILKGSGALEAALSPKGVAVRWSEFQAGPQLLEAMNAGSIDLGHAADAPSVFAQATGVDFVYLAAEPPYPQGIAILVPADSPLRTVAELRGRKVAIGRGWNVQYMLVRALEEAGLTYATFRPLSS